MTSSNTYHPTDEFRDDLERELLRRHRRNLLELSRRQAGSGFAKAAVMIIVSGSIGATAGFASAQIHQGGTRDSLLAAAQVDALLAKTRFDLAKVEADDVTLRVRAGAVGQEDAAASIAELRDMDARWQAAQLNIQEINASGHAPRDDLGAPLISGRDYVKQRIALQLAATQAKLDAAETTEAESERRYRAGAETEDAVTNSRLKVTHVEGQLAVLAEQVRLRDEFLAHATSPALLAQRAENAQLRADASYDQAELSAARARLATVEKRRAVGAATDVELLRAQLGVKELEIELQRLTSRLRAAK